jgi:hypothetical protein
MQWSEALVGLAVRFGPQLAAIAATVSWCSRHHMANQAMPSSGCMITEETKSIRACLISSESGRTLSFNPWAIYLVYPVPWPRGNIRDALSSKRQRSGCSTEQSLTKARVWVNKYRGFGHIHVGYGPLVWWWEPGERKPGLIRGPRFSRVIGSAHGPLARYRRSHLVAMEKYVGCGVLKEPVGDHPDLIEPGC